MKIEACLNVGFEGTIANNCITSSGNLKYFPISKVQIAPITQCRRLLKSCDTILSIDALTRYSILSIQV